ncbi:MAG: histidine phosphatase family protein [Cyanobacteria bacterium J06639_14]
MLKLLFIRHGESTGNQAHRMTGQSDDHLTYLGQQQCQELAQYLYRQEWSPSHVYTSPLRRAVESLACLLEPWEWSLPDEVRSAHPIQEPITINKTTLVGDGQTLSPPPIKVSGHLQEFHAGILTGLTWPEAKYQYPMLCQTLETSLDWVPIPNAETPLDGRRRAHDFIQQLLANHQNDHRIWVISHHWIMEHLIATLMGCDRTWQMTIPNTALFEFWIDCDRWTQGGMNLGLSTLWQIKRFGDCPHLSRL